MQNVRIYDMPDCKMVSSGSGMFGEENLSKGFSVLGRKRVPMAIFV